MGRLKAFQIWLHNRGISAEAYTEMQEDDKFELADRYNRKFTTGRKAHGLKRDEQRHKRKHDN